jgi:hypothetical protein
MREKRLRRLSLRRISSRIIVFLYDHEQRQVPEQFGNIYVFLDKHDISQRRDSITTERTRISKVLDILLVTIPSKRISTLTPV